MRVPLTSRQCAFKRFYVFFSFGGRYSNKYAVIQAQSYEKAKYKAIELYGIHEIGSVVADKERAESKIRAYGMIQL